MVALLRDGLMVECSSVNSLPLDILLHIFSYISFDGVGNLLRVCKDWNKTIFHHKHEDPWRHWFHTSLWFPPKCGKRNNIDNHNSNSNNNQNNSNNRKNNGCCKIRNNIYWRERLLNHKSLERCWKGGEYQKELFAFDHPDLVQHFCFRDDLFLVGSEQAVRLWNLKDRRMVHHIPVADNNLSASLSPGGFSWDESRIAICGTRGVKIYDLASGEFKHLLDAENTRCLTFNKDHFVSVLRMYREIKLWDPLTFQAREVIRCPEDIGIHTAEISGNILLTGTFHQIKAWDLRANQMCVKSYRPGAGGKLLHIVNNTIVAGKVSSTSINMFDIRVEDNKTTIELQYQPYCLALEGSKMVTSGGNKLEIWDTRCLSKYKTINEGNCWNVQTDSEEMLFSSNRTLFGYTLQRCKFGMKEE